jgi:hypothetical protein
MNDIVELFIETGRSPISHHGVAALHHPLREPYPCLARTLTLPLCGGFHLQKLAHLDQPTNLGASVAAMDHKAYPVLFKPGKVRVISRPTTNPRVALRLPANDTMAPSGQMRF